jgi:tetratricopeptide (TPR) repeat protein
MMLGAMMLAILVMNGRMSLGESRKYPLWLVLAVLPLVLATASAWNGNSRYYASHLVYTTSEYLAKLQLDPDRIFDDPALATYLERQYEMAVQLAPENADAWNGIGNARLARLYAELEPVSEIAERALPAYEVAAGLYPGSWVAEFGLARCKAMAGAEASEVLVHLRKAVELAPYRPEPLSMLGNVLLLEDRKSAEAENYLKQANTLAYAYLPAADALEKIRLDSASSSSARSRTSLVDLAYIAEQHGLIPAMPDRVTGAGLIEIKNPVHSLLEE